jgi:hypothetical protein
MFNGASPRRVEVDAVGLCRDGDERRRLRLAPRRVGLVDVGGAGEPGDRDGADIGDREVGVQRLLKSKVIACVARFCTASRNDRVCAKITV